MKVYDCCGREVNDEDAFESYAWKIVLDSSEDVKKFRSFISSNDFEYGDVYDEIIEPGCYKYFNELDKFLKKRSFKEACDILRLTKDSYYCRIDGDDYYC